MRCIVCDNDIRIDTLKQLFALAPLLLCGRCSQNLIPKSADVLYEDNEWIRLVIDRLNQGDIALIQLFKKDLKKALLNKDVVNSKVEVIEIKEDLPYPWLEILVDDVVGDSKRNTLEKPAESFVVAVEKQERVSHQIVVVG